MKYFVPLISLIFLFNHSLAEAGPNQTDTLSPIYPQSLLPFDMSIQKSDFMLPAGIHSGAFALYKGFWIFVGGRTNGLHGFDAGNDNFPPSRQNIIVYVVDPSTQTVFSRSLNDPLSGLTQQQIDQLSATSPQFFFTERTLYICGGYGVDTDTGLFSTKSVLTAIDLDGIVGWVVSPNSGAILSNYLRQTTHPLLQVTGGYMASVNPHLQCLLIFGQNFEGFYSVNSNGNYTNQVRCFQIIDNNGKLYVQPRKSEPQNPSYRRRDLNVVPILRNNKQSFTALSGVFTLDTGIWTVPVHINLNGTTFMPDPANPNTFKQGMNNYDSAFVGLYSGSTNDMYIILLGGISFGFFQNGVFTTDDEIPFINQVTTIKIDNQEKYTQYLMNNQYPTIISTGPNPGNPLLFGASAYFIPASNVPLYSNGVVQLDKITRPTVLGYIVGGIMSTLPNTNTQADSAASPYIFEVLVTPL